MSATPRYRFPNSITIYYRTETGKKFTTVNNKAWLIFYYKGDIYAEENDPIINEYYAIRNLNNTTGARSYDLANELTMQKLNNENRWFVFKSITSIDDLDTILKKYFSRAKTRHECWSVRDKLIDLEEELIQREKEKWQTMKDNYTD